MAKRPKQTQPRFIATAVSLRMAELRTIAPDEYQQLCRKFAGYFAGVARNEISGWLGLDLHSCAAALNDPVRFAQLAMLVPKLARSLYELAELDEAFRLLGDEELHTQMQQHMAAADEFRTGIRTALLHHKDDRHKNFPDLVDALIKFRTATKPYLAGIRAAYAQVFAVTVTRASFYLSPVYQRKLPSAIPPIGRTLKVAYMEGSIQGLYQRLGPQADEVWAQVKPQIMSDLDLLLRNSGGLANSLRDAGLQFARM
jgi:hypothetical protein